MSSSLNPTEKSQEELKKQQQQQGLLSWFNPANWFSGFSFGGIFQGLLLAVGSYFLGSSEWFQNAVGPLLDGDKPGSGKDKIKGFFDSIKEFFTDLAAKVMPKSMKENIDITKEVLEATAEQVTEKTKDLPEKLQKLVVENYTALATLAKEALGGKITAADMEDATTLFTDDRVIFKLLTEKPDLAAQFLDAVEINPQAGNTAIAQKLVASLQKIAGDKRLDTLLSAQHRKNTIALMVRLGASKKGLTAEALESMITSDLEQHNGTPSETLRNALRTMISGIAPAAETRQQTEEQPTQPDPATEAATTALFIKGQLGKSAHAAIDTLRAAMGDQDFLQLTKTLSMDTGTPEGKAAQQRLLTHLGLKAANRKAILNFLSTVDKAALPEEWRQVATQIEDKLKAVGAKPASYQQALDSIATKRSASGKMLDIYGFQQAFQNVKTPEAFLRQLADPQLLNFIHAAGVDEVATLMAHEAGNPKLKQFLTPENLAACCNFVYSMHNFKMPAGASYRIDDAITATSAVMEMALTGNGAPMKTHAKLIAEIFRGGQFGAAFKTLLASLNVTDKNKAKMLGAVVREWGTREDGILEILTSADDVARLPDLLSGKSSVGWAEAVFGTTLIGENSKHLAAVRDAMNVTAEKPVAPNIANAPHNYSLGYRGL